MVEIEYFKTMPEAAQHFKRNERTVRRWLKRMGVKRQASGHSRQKLEECANIMQSGSIRISPMETEQLCSELEVAIGALNNIQSRFKQLLY